MRHIVLVDDDLFIRDLLGTKLSTHYSVKTAANAADGFAAINEKRPDLILLDLELPDKHGLEILKELKGNPSHSDIPVFIFSNNEPDDWRDKVIEAGAEDFFLKVTMDASQLKQQVDDFFEKLIDTE